MAADNLADTATFFLAAKSGQRVGVDQRLVGEVGRHRRATPEKDRTRTHAAIEERNVERDRPLPVAVRSIELPLDGNGTATNGRGILCATAAARDGVTAMSERDFDGRSIHWLSLWKRTVFFILCVRVWTVAVSAIDGLVTPACDATHAPARPDDTKHHRAHPP